MRLEARVRRAARRGGSVIAGASALLAVALLGFVLQPIANGGEAEAKGNSKKASVKVMIADGDESADEEFEREKLEELTKEVTKRLRTRLEAAKFKHFSIDTEPPRTLHVSAGGGVPSALLAGLVVPQGHFEVRPAEAVGQRWTNLAAKLPAGVEIRQEKGSFSASDAYLFSRSRQKLEEVIAEADFGGVDVHLYSVGDGWRTLALSKPVASHHDISGASIRQGKTGAMHVEVRFNRQVVATPSSSRARHTFAAVLDGEVVATFQRVDADFGESLTLAAPEHLGSDKHRRMWAQQVAGRLAAYLPIPLVEMSR